MASRSPHPDEPVFEAVGNYDLVKNIGRGQFGQVKLAVHALTGEKVAIKIINKNILDELSLRLVYREIKIMKLLRHPSIITLYEVIETEDHLYLIMEYAEGGEVLDFIVAHGRLRENEARRWFAQTLAAIHYCHQMHVVHRDLKAENLLLDENFQIKIIDFGLSNTFLPNQRLNTFCGSPTYAAPEVIQREEYRGPEVDIWSLGVVLYVMVCGRLPFTGQNFMELYRHILSADFTIPSHVSAECADLVRKMLVTDPEKRITVHQISLHPWVYSALVELQANAQPVPEFTRPNSREEMNEEVLDLLTGFYGFDREEVIASVLGDLYDERASSYFLLCQRVDKRRARKRSRSRSQSSTSRVKKELSSGGGAAETPVPQPSRDNKPFRKGHRRVRTVDERVSMDLTSDAIDTDNMPRKSRRQRYHHGKGEFQVSPSPRSPPPTTHAQRVSPNLSPTASPRSSKEHERPSPGPGVKTQRPRRSKPRSGSELAPRTRYASTGSNNYHNHVTVSGAVANSSSGESPPTSPPPMLIETQPSVELEPHKIRHDVSSHVVAPDYSMLVPVSPTASSSSPQSSSPGTSPSPPHHQGSGVRTVSSQPTERRRAGGATSRGGRRGHQRNKSDTHSMYRVIQESPHRAKRTNIVQPPTEERHVRLSDSGSAPLETRTRSDSVDKDWVIVKSTRVTDMEEQEDDSSASSGLNVDKGRKLALSPALATPVRSRSNSSATPDSNESSKFPRLHSIMSAVRNKLGLLSINEREAEAEAHREARRNQQEPRTVRFAFSVKTTSAKGVNELVAEVRRVLESMSIAYHTTGPYALECQLETTDHKEIRFEVEICRIPRLSLNGVRIKRIGGDTWTYKNVCSTLISQMSL